MRTLGLFVAAITLGAALAVPASAQSFNLDSDTAVVGNPALGAPTSAFAGAAAQPGTWNAISGITDTMITLNNLNGSPSTATFTRQTASGGNFASDNPNTTRDFQLLLDDGWDLSGSTGFQTMTFAGLQNGTYEVYTYAIAPDVPTADITIVRVGSDTATEQNCGGAAMPTNAFALGVTHVVHTVVVTDGTLQMQADGAVGSFGTINGIQIKLLPGNDCPEDTNDDNMVNVTDLLAVISAWGSCTGCPADTNDDGLVNVTDLLAIISAWGPC